MRFGLLLIGDELLDGKTGDANIKTLGTFLSERGHPLTNVLVTTDDEVAIERALGLLYKELNCEFVITSGGLGPTPDDKTKAALARYFKDELHVRADVADLVAAQYSALGRKWHSGVNSYDLFPRKFEALLNSTGFAPGLFFLAPEGEKIASFPGVPREFKSMLEESLWPKLKELALVVEKEQRRLCVRTMGVPEEKIFFELAPKLWEELSLLGEVASYPQSMGVDIVVREKESSPSHWYAKAQAKVESSAIKEFIWQVGEEDLPSFLLHLLKEKKLTLALAESCTGGLAASLLTDIPGSSQIFKGSYVTYHNDLKMSALGVKEETLTTWGAVSTQVAQEMAQGARLAAGSDLAIAFSGIAGPGGGSDEKPVGTVAIAISGPLGEHSELFHFRGERELLKLRFALKGFHLAREEVARL